MKLCDLCLLVCLFAKLFFLRLVGHEIPSNVLCSEETSVGPYSGNVKTSHIVLHINFSINLVQLQTTQKKSRESLTWSWFAGIIFIRVLGSFIEGLR